MKKAVSIRPIFCFFLFLFILSCGPKITPIDRALVFQNNYEILETTYKNQYELATDFEKKWLKENVAPIIDDLRQLIISYTKLTLLGNDDSQSRDEIIKLYRKATLKLTQEVFE